MPRAYLNELRIHLSLYPNETNVRLPHLLDDLSPTDRARQFRVTLQPNVACECRHRGLRRSQAQSLILPNAVGEITCLHPSCDRKTLKLQARFRAPDGGLKDGIGSLSVYRVRDALSAARNVY